DEQSPAGLQNAEDFTHVVGQVRPVVLRLDGRYQVELIFWIGQLRYRGLLDLDAARLDQGCIFRARRGHAAGGVVDAVDIAGGCQRSELLNGPAAPAPYIENREVLADLNVTQSPIRQRGMGEIHDPSEKPACESVWLSNLP